MEKRYRPRHLSGNAIVYRTVDTGRYTGSSTLGWERHIRGPIETRRVPGGHVSLLLDPNVEVVAQEMEADIRAAQEEVAATKVLAAARG